VDPFAITQVIPEDFSGLKRIKLVQTFLCYF